MTDSLTPYIQNIAAGNHTHVTVGSRCIEDGVLLTIAKAVVGNVVSFDATSNKITGAGLIQFLDVMAENTTIVDYSFEDNQIDDAAAQVALTFVQARPFIKSFQLAGNGGIMDATLEKIAEVVAWNRQPQGVKTASVGEVVDLSPAEGTTHRINLTDISVALDKNVTVRELNLARCELGDHGAEEVAKIIVNKPNLKVLNLSSNRIGTHGIRAFNECSKLKLNRTLQQLILTDNKLSDEAARILVDVLRTNDTLVAVDTSNNGITQSASETLHRAIFLNQQPLALKHAVFAVQENQEELTTIDFQWAAGMEQSATFLGPALKFNCTLTSLNLGNCELGDEGCAFLAPAFKTNKALRVLALPNNGITSAGATLLAQGLVHNQALIELNLANNRINDDGARAFTEMLSVNAILTCINMENNEINDELMTELEGLTVVNECPLAVKKILPLLEANDASLTELNFSVFDGVRYHNDASARVIAQALLTNTSVTSLDFSGNNIADTGAAYLADILGTTTTLKKLNLAHNSFTDRGVLIMIEALLKNTSLVEWNLCDNRLTDTTGEQIVQLLQHNDTLETIILDGTRVSIEVYNEIRIAGVINMQPLSLKLALSRLRSRDDSFKVLDLHVFDGFRYFTDASVKILCNSMHNTGYVTEINLAANQVEAGGVEALCELLVEPNCAIQILNLAHNPIDDAGAKYLAEALMQNTSLVQLDLRGTNITSAGVLDLCAALQQNNTCLAIAVNDQTTISPAATAALARELALNARTVTLKGVLPHIYANTPEVTELYLTSDGEGRPFDDTSCQLLALALVQNTTITKVDISNNQVTKEGVEYLVDMLNTNTTITHLGLSNNRINDDGARSIIRCLESNNSLVAVELAENPVSDRCMAEIFYLLRINGGPMRLKQVMLLLADNDPSVELLDFNSADTTDRKFDEEAVHILCSLLVDNHCVRGIDLSHNDITDTGASLLADLLRTNFTLEALHLDYNPLGVEGAEALFQALKANHVLHTLTLEGNSIPHSTMESLASVLHVNAVPHQPGQEGTMKAVRGPRKIEQLDDHTMFRDTAYLREKEAEITAQGYAEYEMRLQEWKARQATPVPAITEG